MANGVENEALRVAFEIAREHGAPEGEASRAALIAEVGAEALALEMARAEALVDALEGPWWEEVEAELGDASLAPLPQALEAALVDLTVNAPPQGQERTRRKPTKPER